MVDERDKLVSALRTRLSELDAKVAAFRRDQADEFRRYASRLLSAVTADVAIDVAHTINSEASDRTDGQVRYAALYPGFLRDGGSDTADVVVLDGAPLPASFSVPLPARPPVLPDESPPRGHNRNDDFRGVFTPPFLPLLDGSSHSRPARSLPDTAAAATTTTATATVREAAAMPLSAPSPPLSTPSPISPAEEAEEAEEPQPQPQQRLKSALRRPLSSLSLSTRRPSEPRRVRFSFDGKEVLPTSSPPRFEDEQDFSWLLPSHQSHSIGAAFDDIDLARYNNISNNFSSALPEDLGVASAFVDTCAAPNSLAAGGEQEPLFLSAGGDSQQSGQPAGDQDRWGLSTGCDDSGLEPHYQAASDESNLQDHRRPHSLILDDDELDTAPLARKLSSSDLLRALSKVPLEDPSMWTVVDPQSDPTDVQLDVNSFVSKPKAAEDRLHIGLPLRGEDSTQDSEKQPQRDSFNHSNHYNHRNNIDIGKEEDRSYNDPFIAMRPSRELAQQEVAGAAKSLSAPSDLPVALSKSPQEPISAAEPPPPAVNGAAAAAATIATKAAQATTTATIAPPVQNTMPNSRTAGQSPSPQKKLAPQTEVEPAEDDDLFEFEQDINADSDDVVGYPLARVSSARPYIGDEDSDADDAEAALVEASELEDKKAHRQDDEKISKLLVNKDVGFAGVADDEGNSGNVKSGPLQGLPAILANHRQMMPRDVSQSLNRASLNRTNHGQNRNQSQNISVSLGSAHGATSASFGRPGTAMPPTVSTVPTSPTTPTTPTSPSFAASVGSYRGRPISMFNVVKDPRILQEVAQLGEFSSFVGGVDGRTGVDGVDDVVGSFAARDLQSQNSLCLSGTPRSLSERMAMEEIFRGRR